MAATLCDVRGSTRMSVLQETNEQILIGVRHHWRSDAQRRRISNPVRLIDGLIADLEELHLADRKRVPSSFDERLRHLTAVLAPEVRQELRARVTIVHLMEQLYEIQGRLLARRSTARGHFEGGHSPWYATAESSGRTGGIGSSLLDETALISGAAPPLPSSSESSSSG